MYCPIFLPLQSYNQRLQLNNAVFFLTSSSDPGSSLPWIPSYFIRLLMLDTFLLQTPGLSETRLNIVWLIQKRPVLYALTVSTLPFCSIICKLKVFTSVCWALFLTLKSNMSSWCTILLRKINLALGKTELLSVIITWLEKVLLFDAGWVRGGGIRIYR